MLRTACIDLLSVLQSNVLSLLLRYNIVIHTQKKLPKIEHILLKKFIFSSTVYVFLWIISEVLEWISILFGNVCAKRVYIHWVRKEMYSFMKGLSNVNGMHIEIELWDHAHDFSTILLQLAHLLLFVYKLTWGHYVSNVIPLPISEASL